MAILAFFAVLSLVLVIAFMTSDTILRYPQVSFVGMTVAASHAFVFSLQRKFCFTMVIHKVIPGTGSVATVTLLAQLTLMRLYFLMAVNAPGFRLIVFLIFLMTLVAGYRGMAFLQQEVGKIVIKGLIVENYDIISSALML